MEITEVETPEVRQARQRREQAERIDAYRRGESPEPAEGNTSEEEAEYVALLDSGLSDAEARGTVWPEPIPGQLDTEGGEVRDVPPLGELRLEGPAQLGLFHAGGKRPMSATLRLVGGAVELTDGTAYEKGQVIRFEGTAVVMEVAQRDKHDTGTGQVVECVQKHQARITDLWVPRS